MRIRAAVAREKGRPFRMEELTLDGPRSDEVVVEVSAVGACHTDIAARDQWLPVPLPSVLGHEGAGVVIAMGSAVTKVAPGDRVVMTFRWCGSCRYCASGHPAYCADLPAWTTGGGRPDGTNALHGDGPIHGSFFSQSSFATHAIATERSVVKVGRDTDLTVAAPLGCGIQTGAGTVLNRLLTAGRTITGVTEGDSRPDQLIPALLELHRQGRFPVDRLITRYPLAEINQAVADTEAGRAVKAVLEAAGSRSG